MNLGFLKFAKDSYSSTGKYKIHSMRSFGLAISLLLASALIIMILIVYLWRRKSQPHFAIIFLSSFLMAFPVSGLIHLLRNPTKGYFNLHQNGLQYLSSQAALMVLGMSACITLCYVNQKEARSQGREQFTFDKKISTFMLISSAPLLAVGAFASENLSKAFELQIYNRVISVSDGNARYAYIAVWGVWGAIFLGSAILDKFHFSKIGNFVVAGATVISIFHLLNWTGSRLAPLIYAGTFVVGNFMYLKSAPRLSIPFGVTGYLVFAILTTNRRSLGYSGEQNFSFLDVIDWQAGRFSILGGSIWTADINGYLHGESFIFTWKLLTEGVEKLLDLPAQLEIGNTQSISQVLGYGILGSDKINYIAPGLLVEIFLNFGFPGMLLSIPICIFLLNQIQLNYKKSTDKLGRMIHFYFGSILIHCAIISSSMSLLGSFVFNPIPIYFLFLYSRIKRGLPKNDF